MSIRGTRLLYICLYLVAIGLIGLQFFCGLNYLTEMGAVIVAVAIYRGTRKFKFSGSSPELKKLAEGAEVNILKWDLTALIIGTLLNGFAHLIGQIIG